MESNNLTTRTYTAPTCSLVVTTKAPLLPNLTQLKKPQAVDFSLHLGNPEQAEAERLVLKGDPLQLSKLQQSVSKYVADLVAKFPNPTTDSHNPTAQPANPASSTEQIVDRQTRPNPAESARGSGLSQNLPGLRIGTKQSTPVNRTEVNQVDAPASPLSTKNISKLLGLENAANRVSDVAPKANPAETAPQTPYLIGGDRSLDHKLHLGNLATSNSGEVLTLSAIQLFDLATTLDEYAAEVGAPKSNVMGNAAVREPEASSGVTGNKPFDPTLVKPVVPKAETAPAGIGESNPVSPKLADLVTPLNTPPSHLPNLPQAPTPRTTSQVYDYANNGGSRPAFLAVIPWAAAAALAVGIPLLLFGSKSNSLKELTSNVKLPANVKLPTFKTPNFEAAKQSVMSRLPGQEPATSTDSTDVATNPGATGTTNPKPWDQQPIQPPQTPPGAKMPGAQMPTSPDKIGIAPLPPTMMDSVGQVPTTAPNVATKPAMPTQAAGVTATAKPATPGLTDIAPNPLSSPSLPPQLPSPIASQSAQAKPISVATTTKPNQPKISNPVTTLPVTPAKIATAPKIVKPKVTGIQPGKISIAKQPLAMPPDLTAGTINPTPINTKVPFSQPEIQVAERVNPRPLQPAAKKKIVKAKVKPKAVAIASKAKTPKPTGSVLTPEPVLEPFNPSPNPNLINPIPPTSGEGTNTQPNSPAFPEQQPQPNIGRNPNTADPFDSPSLKETKRYFQGKWQADPNQPNSLQYVVRVSGKSGLVQTVSPQGEPATEYLKKTKIVKPGDKLVSPAAAGRSDQKIRVVLQPDGTVDAFGEP
jgi:Domain of unknown function (DUF4335)